MQTITEPSGWVIFGDNIKGRTCASCQFCCIHVPVEAPLFKPAGQTCVHLRHKGCGIYARRPSPCKAWSCTWLTHIETANMKRPDLAGYAIDPMPQTVLIEHKPYTAIQIWVDINRPDAHKDPALRAYLSDMADKHGYISIVRWSDGQKQDGREAMVLIPPQYNLDKDGWIEKRSPMLSKEGFAKEVEAITKSV